MTYFEDLTPYRYLPNQPAMLNVGWLSRGHEFPKGPIPDEVVAALYVLADEQENNILRGVHDCEFCTRESPMRLPAPVARGFVDLGMGELHAFVPGSETYSAPSLIVHYITEHGYQPPVAFMEAVLLTARADGVSAASRSGD
ncbi:MAG: hypothetical protein ACRDTJ_14420 [Pseudonocardiaceae bacterium]